MRINRHQLGDAIWTSLIFFGLLGVLVYIALGCTLVLGDMTTNSTRNMGGDHTAPPAASSGGEVGASTQMLVLEPPVVEDDNLGYGK